MLKFLRKRQRSLWIIIAFAIIIIVFIFWGIGSFRVDKGGIVARVNGQVITAKEFARVYQRQVNLYRNTFKDEFREELLEKLNLKERVLESLINRAIVLREAKRQGLKVKKEELQKTIQAMPEFQRDGVFDKDLYFAILKANRILPGEFEKDVEEGLLLEKVQEGILNAIKVSDKEALDFYNRENKRVNLQYLVIEAATLERDITVTDEEARDYFDKNRHAFNIPTRVKAVYIVLSPKDFYSKVKVSEDDIKGYYEKNLKGFQMPKEVKARHILIRPASNSQEEIDKAKAKAEEVLNLARKGEDFSQLARRYSQDPGSAPHGGDLGYFREGQMVKPFEEAAFSLKKGEISPIVKSQFGFHIIRVEDIKEARLIPLKEARARILETLSKEEGTRLAKKMAQDVQGEIGKGKDIKDVALKFGLKTRETGFFSERDNTELTRSEPLRKVVFGLKMGETSEPVDALDNLYIVKVVDREEGRLPEYKEVSSNVKAVLKGVKARNKAREVGEALLKRLREGEDIMALAKKEGYRVEEGGFFSMAEGVIPGLGIPVTDKKDIFSLSMDAPYYPQVVSAGGRFYILKLKDVQEADPKGFEEKRKGVMDRLMQEKRQEAFEKWIKDLRSKAKIEINREAI